MRREAGFTLIEVLVALVVAVAGMAVVSQGFTTGARASSRSQNTTRAAFLAKHLITDFETGALTLTQSHAGPFDDAPDYSYETKSESGDPGLTLLTVTVTWDERNQPRTYVLTRLLRERPTTP